MTLTTQRSWTLLWIDRHPFSAFALLAYAISWVCWIPAGLILPPTSAQAAHFAGAFGPMLAAMIVVGIRGGSLSKWLISLLKWRVGLEWYAFVLFFPALLIAIMSAIYLSIGHTLDWALFPERLSIYLPTLAFMAVFGGGNEEPGWRGFGLPELQKSFSPAIATLILGVVWAFWHAPILLGIEEVMSGAMPAGALLQLTGVTLVSITMHAFWYTWLFNRTGSVLLCILLHAGYNTANGLLLLVGVEALSGSSYQTLLVLMTSVLVGSVAILLIATRGRLGAS